MQTPCEYGCATLLPGNMKLTQFSVEGMLRRGGDWLPGKRGFAGTTEEAHRIRFYSHGRIRDREQLQLQGDGISIETFET